MKNRKTRRVPYVRESLHVKTSSHEAIRDGLIACKINAFFGEQAPGWVSVYPQQSGQPNSDQEEDRIAAFSGIVPAPILCFWESEYGGKGYRLYEKGRLLDEKSNHLPPASFYEENGLLLPAQWESYQGNAAMLLPLCLPEVTPEQVSTALRNVDWQETLLPLLGMEEAIIEREFAEILQQKGHFGMEHIEIRETTVS